MTAHEGWPRMLNDQRWQRSRWQTVSPPCGWRGQFGIGSVEFMVAVPVLLLVGLLIWQWALVLQARQVVDFAVREGARYGAVGHAEAEAIEQGLASGLAPLWVNSHALGSPHESLAASAQKFTVATGQGWLSWRQITPTRESFTDWAVSPDPSSVRGRASASPEIPIDNPVWRSRHAEPASGASLTDRGERVGHASGQTFREAGVLRIELSVGVPLVVPLAGRFISWAARSLSGCADDPAPRFGAVRVDGASLATTASSPMEPIATTAEAALPVCALYRGADDVGQFLPRIPLRAIGEARMQSSARLTARTPSAGPRAPSEQGAQGIPSTPTTGPTVAGVGDAERSVDVSVDAAVASNSSARPPGFLRIGAEREIWSPGSCGIAPG